MCSWTDPSSGESFNLQGMAQKDAGQGWVVHPSGHQSEIFYTNICTEVTHECKGSANGGPAVATQFQNNQCIANLAVVANPQWSLLESGNPEAGVQVKWAGGDACGNEKPEGRDLTIKVACDRSLSQTEFVDAGEPSMCTYVMNFKGPDGCPGNNPDGLGSGWTFVVLVLVGFSLYCGLGTLYNVKRNNLQGTEALPNSAFWKDLPDLVKTGCKFSYEKAKELKEKYSGNGGYSNPDFDDIDDDAY